MTFNRNNKDQKRGFKAGYLWLHFLMKWDLFEVDIEKAEEAYEMWCDHMESKDG